MTPAAPRDDPAAGGAFERRMKMIGLAAGPAAALIVYLVNPGDHAPPARRLLSILALTVVWWMTEAIPLPATALLASSLCIVAGVAPARTVLSPYADPVIFLFIGSFLLAEAFKKYGLDRRLAQRLLGRGRLARSRAGRSVGVGGASAVISTFLSNTASAALMTPIAIGAVRERGRTIGATGDTGDSDADGSVCPPWISGVLLMVAYGASLGGMATLIGTPPNLLVAGFLDRLCGVHVGFLPWILFAAPIALVLLAASMVWTHVALGDRDGAAHGAGSGQPPGSAPPAVAGDMAAPAPAADSGIAPGEGQAPPRWMSHGARLTMAAFLLAAILWTIPSLAAVVLGSGATLTAALHSHLPEAGVALLCATLLFVAPVDWSRRRFALSWEEGRRVNWGIIMLFGGGLSLGTLAETTGVARWVGEGLQQVGIARSGPGLLFCAVALSILVTEFASNTASVTLLVPIVIAAAQAAGLDPVRPALGVALAATCAFIFPVSTPPNAIVFGTGLVPLRRMIRAGTLLDLTALVVIWAGLLLLTPILPR